MQARAIITTTAIAACGISLWYQAGSALASPGDYTYLPNPFGIKKSPYGQVLAMAIQAPVDADWTARYQRASQSKAEKSEPPNGGTPDSTACCSSSGCAEGRHLGVSARPESLLARLDAAATERTNPRPPSSAHDFYLRNQVEKRLHFAWSLDPSNYGNYHSYHLFLSESSVGTQEVLGKDWIEHGLKVARYTIDYGLAEQNDPRPALTAAAAAANSLELMMHKQHQRPDAELRAMLSTLDLALGKHALLSNAWVESGAWANLSAMRQQEVSDRYTFLLKIRDANAAAIERLANSGSQRAAPDIGRSPQDTANLH